jgi:hypothetical protein
VAVEQLNPLSEKSTAEPLSFQSERADKKRKREGESETVQEREESRESLRLCSHHSIPNARDATLCFGFVLVILFLLAKYVPSPHLRKRSNRRGPIK